MVDRPLAETPLDEAIDRAVREMMNVEPRPGLRQRVLAELGGEPSRAILWPRLVIGAAGAAVAIFLVLRAGQEPAERPVEEVVVATSPTTPPADATQSASPSPRRPPQVAARRPTHPPPSGEAARPRVLPGDDRPVQAASIDPAELDAAPMTSLAPLNPIDPISVSTLDVPRTIDIKPIALEPIAIAPRTPRQ